MNPFEYEDLVGERLKDMLREAEARHFSAGRPEPVLASLRRLALRAWLLAGVAMQRPPRRHARPAAPASPTLAAWRLRSPNR